MLHFICSPETIFLLSILFFWCTICHSWDVIAAFSLKDFVLSFWSRFRHNRGLRRLVHVEVYHPLMEGEVELSNTDDGEEERRSTSSTVNTEQIEQLAMVSSDVIDESPTRSVNSITIPTEGSNSKSYSLVMSQEYYYAVMQQVAIPSTYGDRIVPSRDVSMYAITTCKKFSDYVASLVLGDSLVYVCMFNPMTDPPLFMLRELISNGQKDSPIFLVIILPPMKLLERALKEQCEWRVRTQKCSQYVSTFSDFEDLLLKSSTGFLSQEVSFVLPIAPGVTDIDLEEKQIWKSARELLGNENCHRIGS